MSTNPCNAITKLISNGHVDAPTLGGMKVGLDYYDGAEVRTGCLAGVLF